jgi:hypothetical protein
VRERGVQLGFGICSQGVKQLVKDLVQKDQDVVEFAS